MLGDKSTTTEGTGHGFSVFLAAAIVMIGVLGGSVPAIAETIDRVLAVAAGQLIMLSDVTAARDLGIVSADGAADPVRAILTKLIDRQLVLAEVDRYAPPEPPADLVDRGVAAVRARFASPDAFETVLRRSGLDDQQVRQLVRDNLRIDAYLEQRFIAAGDSAADQRQARIDEWTNGLRRRGAVIDLYLPAR